MGIMKKLNELFSKKEEPRQETPKPSVSDEGVRSGQEVIDAIENLKADLPEYVGPSLSLEDIGQITIALDTMGRILSGQQAETDVSELDECLKELFRKMIPGLLKENGAAGRWKDAQKELTDILKSRSGDTNAVRKAYIRALILTYETEKRQLEVQWTEFDGHVKQYQKDFDDITAPYSHLKAYELPDEVRERSGQIMTLMQDATVQRNSIRQSLDICENNLQRWKLEMATLNMKDALVSDETMQAARASMEQYKTTIMDLQEQMTKWVEQARTQEASLRATIQVLSEQQQKQMRQTTLSSKEMEQIDQLRNLSKTETAQEEQTQAQQEATEENVMTDEQ